MHAFYKLREDPAIPRGVWAKNAEILNVILSFLFILNQGITVKRIHMVKFF
jgi:hypothetical protein